MRQSENLAYLHCRWHCDVRAYRIYSRYAVLLRESGHAFYALYVYLFKIVQVRDARVHSRIAAAHYFKAVALAVFYRVNLCISRSQDQDSFFHSVIPSEIVNYTCKNSQRSINSFAVRYLLSLRSYVSHYVALAAVPCCTAQHPAAIIRSDSNGVRPPAVPDSFSVYNSIVAYVHRQMPALIIS